jgi:hypothetical protein
MMLDITDELKGLLAELARRDIEYALCGGLAMGVYGHTRATVDIDLLILPESLEKVIEIAKNQGYNIRGKEMSFGQGAIEIRRVSKIDPSAGDLLSLDLLLVTPEVQHVWDTRTEGNWEGGKLSVVTRAGLISLKQLRSSGQDLADIKELEGDLHDQG